MRKARPTLKCPVHSAQCTGYPWSFLVSKGPVWSNSLPSSTTPASCHSRRPETISGDLSKGSSSGLLCPVPGMATVNDYKLRASRQHTGGTSPSSGSEKLGAKVGSGMEPPEGCVSAPQLLPAPSWYCQGPWLSSLGKIGYSCQSQASAPLFPRVPLITK